MINYFKNQIYRLVMSNTGKLVMLVISFVNVLGLSIVAQNYTCLNTDAHLNKVVRVDNSFIYYVSGVPVDTTFFPENQLLSFDSPILNISDGNSVDLSSLVGTTSGIQQDLFLSGGILTLSGDDSPVDLSVLQPWNNEDGTSASNSSININYMNGSVGIGTQIPKYKLHTEGTVGGDYFKVLSDNTNTKYGYQTLESNTTGSRNTGNGYLVLRDNTTGSYNQADGYMALASNTSGSANTANGYITLYKNTTGYNNTVFGVAALQRNTSGANNVAAGVNVLGWNTTGSQNIALGTSALQRNITGTGNIGIGYEAGFYTNSSNKLYIENSRSSSPLIYGDFTQDIININGKLGINNVNPTQSLDVKGNANVSGYVSLQKIVLQDLGDVTVNGNIFNRSDVLYFKDGLGNEYNLLEASSGGSTVNIVTNLREKVVLAIGQSNMSGEDVHAVGGGDLEPDNRVLLWNGTDWEVADPASSSMGGVNHNNLAFHFAKQLADKENIVVKLILDVHSGQPISYWVGAGVNSPGYISMRNQITSSGVKHVDIVLYHQGEGDKSRTVPAYATDWQVLLSQLRGESTIFSSSPIIAGELSDNGIYKTQNGFYENIGTYISDPFVGAAEAKTLPTDNIYNVHFTGASLRIIGRERYWRTYLSLVGQMLVSPNGNCWRLTIDNTGNLVTTSIICE